MKGFSKPNSERQGKTISYRRRSTFLSLFERHIRMQIHFRPGNNFESMLEKRKEKKNRKKEEKNVIHQLLHRRRSISKLSPFRNLCCDFLSWKNRNAIRWKSFSLFLFFLFHRSRDRRRKNLSLSFLQRLAHLIIYYFARLMFLNAATKKEEK